MGLTRVLYVVFSTFEALIRKFLRRKPRVLFALEQMLFTFSSQLRSWWMLTSRYLAEVTVAEVWLPNSNLWLSVFFFLVIGRQVHFSRWKTMS